jgi:hypothetical protein
VKAVGRSIPQFFSTANHSGVKKMIQACSRGQLSVTALQHPGKGGNQECIIAPANAFKDIKVEQTCNSRNLMIIHSHKGLIQLQVCLDWKLYWKL